MTGIPRVLSKSRFLDRAAGLALVLISLNAAWGVVRIFAEGHTVSQQFDLQKKLQFEAMFRDQSSVKHFFGDIQDAAADVCHRSQSCPRSDHTIDFAASKQEGFRGTFNDRDILDGEVLWLGRPLRAITLRKKELLPGLSYRYAPLGSERETRAWLETMSVGTMVEWQLPAAFDPAAW